MSNPQTQDFQVIISALAEEAKKYKKQKFSMLWILDSKNICFIGAANGELRTKIRTTEKDHEYSYSFRNYDEFLGAFSRLEFLIEQVLNMLITEKPTSEGFVRAGLIIEKLEFETKLRLIKEVYPSFLQGMLETLNKLQTLRNSLAHNPVPTGRYGGENMDTSAALLRVQLDYSKCFNALVSTCRDNQYRLLNFIER